MRHNNIINQLGNNSKGTTIQTQVFETHHFSLILSNSECFGCFLLSPETNQHPRKNIRKKSASKRESKLRSPRRKHLCLFPILRTSLRRKTMGCSSMLRSPISDLYLPASSGHHRPHCCGELKNSTER